MIPITQVLGMLGTMALYNYITSAQAVNAASAAAFASGATTGAAAGTALGAVGMAAPGLTRWIVTAPLRLINAPFYYAGGGAAAARRVQVLEEAAKQLAENQREFIAQLTSQHINFGMFDLRYSETFLKEMEKQLRRGTGLITDPNSEFCSGIGKIVDPFNNTYTCILLSEQGTRILITGLVIVTVILGSSIVRIIIRYIIRYSIRGSKALKTTIQKEQAEELIRASKKEFIEKAMQEYKSNIISSNGS